MADLEERRARTQRVMERFQARPFDWRRRGTCIHLARAQMRAMGHRPPPVPDFRSALGARSALARAGHASIADLLDSLLPRIAPAAMLIGDLAALPGGGGLDAIVVAAGGKVLGYHDDHLDRGLVVIEPTAPFIGAWRL